MEKKQKGFYECPCGEEYISDFPYNELHCGACGRTIPRKKYIDEDTARIRSDITKVDIGNYTQSPHYVSLCSFRGNGSTLVNDADVGEVVSILKKLGYEDVILTPQSAAPGTTLISRKSRTKELE